MLLYDLDAAGGAATPLPAAATMNGHVDYAKAAAAVYPGLLARFLNSERELNDYLYVAVARVNIAPVTRTDNVTWWVPGRAARRFSTATPSPCQPSSLLRAMVPRSRSTSRRRSRRALRPAARSSTTSLLQPPASTVSALVCNVLFAHHSGRR